MGDVEVILGRFSSPISQYVVPIFICFFKDKGTFLKVQDWKKPSGRRTHVLCVCMHYETLSSLAVSQNSQVSRPHCLESGLSIALEM